MGDPGTADWTVCVHCVCVGEREIVCAHTYERTHTHTHTCTHTYTHMYAHIHTCTHICTHTHIYMYIYIPVVVWERKRGRMDTRWRRRLFSRRRKVTSTLAGRQLPRHVHCKGTRRRFLRACVCVCVCLWSFDVIFFVLGHRIRSLLFTRLSRGHCSVPVAPKQSHADGNPTRNGSIHTQALVQTVACVL
jgi:hypothetical protein